MRTHRFLLPGLAIFGLALFATAAQANITTAIQLSPDPARPGYPLRAEITVANNGGSGVDDVILQVAVPNEVYIDYSDAWAAGASLSGGTLQWSLGSLGGGRSVRRMLRFTSVRTPPQQPPDGSTITVNAVASYITNPLFPRLTATAQEQVIVDSGNPLALQVTMDRNPASPGEMLTYTLTYGNRGPGTSANTTLDFPLPDRVTFASSSGGTFTNGAVHWDLGTLPEGASARRQVEVQLDDTVMSGTMLRPDEAILAGMVASTARSARSKTVTQVLNAPGLGLAVEMSPQPLRTGERVRASFTVSNQTNAPMDNVMLRVEEWYNDAYFFASDATGPIACPWTCTYPIVWNVGTLAAGQSTVVTMFPFAGNNPLTNGQLIPFNAQVTANGPHESLITHVVATANTHPLTLLVTDSVDPLPAGDPVTYTLHYGNRGADAANAPTLSFPIPPGMQFLSASGGGALAGDTVQWNLSNLPAGQADRQQVRLQAVGLAAGDIVQVDAAQISATVAAVTQSAWGQAATRVIAGQGLKLALDMNPDPARIGERMQAAFTVANPTDIAMNNVVLDVEESYNDAYFFQQYSTGAATCPNTCTRSIRWSLGPLGPRSSRTVTMFPPAGNGPGSVVNGQLIPFTARASADGGQVALVSHVVAVDGTGPLSLEIAEAGDPVQAGNTIGYALLFGNRSGTTALNATLSVPLPAGVALASSSGGTLANGVLSWNLGDVAPGQGGIRLLRLALDGSVPAGSLLSLDAASLTATVAGVTRSARATASVRGQTAAPLTVRLDVSPKAAQPGQPMTLTANITNRGNSGLANLVADIVLPADMNPAGLTISSGGACIPAGCFYGIRWPIAALAEGASTSVTVSGLVRATNQAPPSGRLMAGWAEVRDASGEIATASDAALVSVAADNDGDGVADTFDDCVGVQNSSQVDTDGDGYGNPCDADLNNSGLTTSTDFNLLRSVLNQPSTASPLAAAADINGSGLVTSTDFNLLRARLNTAPGPSGLHP